MVLVEVARRLSALTRPGDVVARLGGDEFVVVAPGIGKQDEAARLVARADEHLSAPLDATPGSRAVSASIGCATRLTGDSARTLLERADHDMYRAKARRRSSRDRDRVLS